MNYKKKPNKQKCKLIISKLRCTTAPSYLIIDIATYAAQKILENGHWLNIVRKNKKAFLFHLRTQVFLTLNTDTTRNSYLKKSGSQMFFLFRKLQAS